MNAGVMSRLAAMNITITIRAPFHVHRYRNASPMSFRIDVGGASCALRISGTRTTIRASMATAAVTMSTDRMAPMGRVAMSTAPIGGAMMLDKP